MLDIQKKLTNSFYALLSLPATAMGFALSIQISALSWILSTKFQLDIHEVGYVWAAGPLAGIIGQVLIGLISDKVWFWHGRRRPFILIGGTFAALSLLALPHIGTIAEVFGFEEVIVVAVMVALTLDLSINISFNPTRSIIADVTPGNNDRTKGYTWMQTVSGLFGVLAYVIGATYGNYFLIYSGTILVFLFSVVPTLFVEEPRELGEVSATSGSSSNSSKASSSTNSIELYKIYAAHGFCWLGVQTMFVYIFAYIQGSMDAMTDDSIGQVIAISFAIMNTVGFLLPVLVLGPLSQKIGRVKTHTIAMAVMAVSYLMIVLIGASPMAIYFIMAFVGVGWAATVSLPFAIVTEKVDQTRVGYFMGIFNLSVVIPQLIVSFGFGTIIQSASSKNVVFIISCVTLAVSTVLWSLVKEGSEKTIDNATSAEDNH